MTSVLVCPTCCRVLDIMNLDKCMISNIYTIDESGNITGFASKLCEGSLALNCTCGYCLDGVRRYSIVKQISQAPTVIDRLLAKLGKMLNTFSRRVYYHEKDLGDSFHAFRNQIRPNPLAANQNRALVTSRAQQLLRLTDKIHEFNVSTAMAFERSLVWLQATLPSTLLNITSRTIQPILSLRLMILLRRALNVWILDCLRVSKYLVGLEDPSLEVQRMGELLRIRASKECWKGIAESEDALAKAMTAEAPAIEVEIRLQQIQLSHLLDIALAGGAEVETRMPTMAPEPSSESLQNAIQLCRRFPDTAGRFMMVVTNFVQFGKKDQNAHETCPSALSSLPRTYTYETRRTELAWGEHATGSLQICERGGHPYSEETFGAEGCPECGRRKDVVLEGMEEEGKKARECLFEDKFLQAMKGK